MARAACDVPLYTVLVLEAQEVRHMPMQEVGMARGRWMPNVWPGPRCGGDGRATGGGQSV